MTFDGIHGEEAATVGEPEDASFSDITGEAPPCEECGKRPQSPDLARDLCEECSSSAEPDSPYPIKVRFPNDSATAHYLASRELEALHGTPEEKRGISDEDLNLVSEVIVGRQKTNLVIRNDRERELAVERLESFRDGIASSYGAEWAKPAYREMINRVLNEIEATLSDERSV